MSFKRVALSPKEFTDFAQHYDPLLRAFLRGMTNGDVELVRDIAQEAFMAAWRVVQASDSPFTNQEDDGDRRRWLYRVAYRRAISTLRHDRMLTWEPLEAEHENLVLSETPFDEQIVEQDMLRHALETLPPLDVATLLLVVVQGFTASEAAQILGASSDAIARRLTRAKHRLLAAYQRQADPLWKDGVR